MATDIASKKELIKLRKSEIAAVETQVGRLVHTWAPEEDVSPPSGILYFLQRLSFCPWFRMRGSKVSTSDVSVESTNGVIKQSGDAKLLMRMVGVRKDNKSETEKIGVAMQTVKSRVESLSDRVKIGRERALRAKSEGRKEDALRELKKSKTLEKQLGAARAAFDTLERQQDMIAESTLQRELATALKSTSAGVKAKSKGLLSLAERAVDESVEVRDDVEDVAAVFDGMTSAYDTGSNDDDALMAELDELTSETVGYASASGAIIPVEVDFDANNVDLFPSVPNGSVSQKVSRGQEKKALLRADSAALGVPGA